MTHEVIESNVAINPKLEERMAGLVHLPGGSETYNRILHELRSPTGTLDQVGHFVASDPAITTELLKNANSASFGFRRIVTDAKDAVMLIGGEQVLAIVMMVDVFSLCDKTACQGFSVPEFFRHSRMVAWNAQVLMRTVTNDREVLGAAFTAGLLHDIGKLLLAVNFPIEYRNCHDKKKEVARLGVDHTELGAHFLRTRKLRPARPDGRRSNDASRLHFYR
jgi:putative nucleotidyltransferase with HDIG domain